MLAGAPYVCRRRNALRLPAHQPSAIPALYRHPPYSLSSQLAHCAHEFRLGLAGLVRPNYRPYCREPLHPPDDPYTSNRKRPSPPDWSVLPEIDLPPRGELTVIAYNLPRQTWPRMVPMTLAL